MDDLVQWLGEQLDEDERIAEEARADGDGRWSYVETRGGDHKVVDSLGYTITGHYDIEAQPYFCEPHIAEHDPARVLREIDAKRKIIERCTAVQGLLLDDFTAEHLADDVLALLAVSYAGHPHYREDWRP